MGNRIDSGSGDYFGREDHLYSRVRWQRHVYHQQAGAEEDQGPPDRFEEPPPRFAQVIVSRTGRRHGPRLAGARRGRPLHAFSNPGRKCVQAARQGTPEAACARGLPRRIAAACLEIRFAGRRRSRIDIGRRSPAFPVTPPYVRVRIRRFGGLSYRPPVNLGIPSESK